jgi:hypothetical protein
MSSGNFDLEENIGEGSGEGRMGLDEEGVEEVRRIMWVTRLFVRASLMSGVGRLSGARLIGRD